MTAHCTRICNASADIAGRIVPSIQLTVVLLFWPVLSQAHEASNVGVQIVSTLNLAGGVQQGGNVQVASFIGDVGGISESEATAGVVAREGGVGMLYSPAAFAVTSASTSLNEDGSMPEESTSTHLAGLIVYDDNTLGVIGGESITWLPMPSEYPLQPISPSGVVKASAVYQDTVAQYAGSYAGLSATNDLLVVNTLNDNYRGWAGDTFNDAWEISQSIPGAVDPNAISGVSGLRYWQLYAMGVNPLGQLDRPVSSARLVDGYPAIVYTRNPMATGYVFNVLQTSDLSASFSPLADAVTTEAIRPDGLVEMITRGSIRIKSLGRQFLTLSIGAAPQP